MSVSNSAYSFSSTDFFKVGGEILQRFNRPSTVLAVGACIGITLRLIQEIQKTNSKALNHKLTESIDKRSEMVLNTWIAASMLAVTGLAIPHRSFVILTAVSSVMSLIFLRGIKGAIERLEHRDPSIKTDLAKAVNLAFKMLIPTAAVTTMLLASAYVQTLEQKV